MVVVFTSTKEAWMVFVLAVIAMVLVIILLVLAMVLVIIILCSPGAGLRCGLLGFLIMPEGEGGLPPREPGPLSTSSYTLCCKIYKTARKKTMLSKKWCCLHRRMGLSQRHPTLPTAAAKYTKQREKNNAFKNIGVAGRICK